MKHLIIATLGLGAAAFFVAAPASAGCSTCTIQTKTAATGGQSAYHISCTDDESGDEKVSNINASSDDQAIAAAQAKCN